MLCLKTFQRSNASLGKTATALLGLFPCLECRYVGLTSNQQFVGLRALNPEDSMYINNIGNNPPNHTQSRPKRQYVPPKHWYLSTKSHTVTSQETVCTSETLVLIHKITRSHVPRDSTYILNIGTYPPNHTQLRPKRQYVHPKHWYLSTKSHTVTSQETVCTSKALVLIHKITRSHVQETVCTSETLVPNHMQSHSTFHSPSEPLHSFLPL